jgi:flagellar assembly protein FliH
VAVKVIRGPAAEASSRWEVPPVEDSAVGEFKGAQGKTTHMLTAGQLDELQRKVQEEAHALGFEQGLSEGQTEARDRVARFAALTDALAHPFEVLDETVTAELGAVAVALARQVVGREIEHDDKLLLKMVNECLAILPVGARDIVVYMNPEDEALVASHLAANDERSWQLRSDPTLGRGDLRVASDGSQIDGRLAVRLEEILAAMTAAVDET